MNVYDFDNTIYDGESVFDFYLYSVRRQPKLIRYLFVVVKAFLKYKFCEQSERDLLFISSETAGKSIDIPYGLTKAVIN